MGPVLLYHVYDPVNTAASDKAVAVTAPAVPLTNDELNDLFQESLPLCSLSLLMVISAVTRSSRKYV
jgi:hypothetical protein